MVAARQGDVGAGYRRHRGARAPRMAGFAELGRLDHRDRPANALFVALILRRSPTTPGAGCGADCESPTVNLTTGKP